MNLKPIVFSISDANKTSVDEIDKSTSSRHFANADLSNAELSNIEMSNIELPNVDMSKSVAFARLEAELESAQKALVLKEEEVTKLSKIREEVSCPSY
jgi:hypothetical protein